MENFYEKMHLDKVEADNFEPPYDYLADEDEPDVSELAKPGQSLMYHAELTKQDEGLSPAWDDRDEPESLYDKPFGEEQERVDLAETRNDDEFYTEEFDRVAWLSKQDELLGEGWDD